MDVLVGVLFYKLSSLPLETAGTSYFFQGGRLTSLPSRILIVIQIRIDLGAQI